MDPVHILMDQVHGPGPQRGSMDQGSMFCTFPVLWARKESLRDLGASINVNTLESLSLGRPIEQGKITA